MPFTHIIFQCHLNDKFLNEEFLTLLMPMINKSDKFILSTENKGELNEHYHCIFEYKNKESDRSKVVQKFKTQPFQKWYKKIKEENLSTIIDSKFEKCALKIIAVKDTPHDLMYVMGYVLKEDTNPKLKGFVEDELLQGIKYYTLNKRIEAKETSTHGWRYMKPNTAHGMITEFKEKNQLSLLDPLFTLMAKEKISSVQLTQKQKIVIIGELAMLEPNLDDFDKSYYKSLLEENEFLQDNYSLHRELDELQTLHTKRMEGFNNLKLENDKLKKLLQSNNISF